MLLKEYDLEEAKEYWKKEAAEEATKEATSRTLARDRILFDLLLTQERYEAVSYTHLDVYKRQAYGTAMNL